MQIKLKGEMTIAQLRQALFEQLHAIEDDFAVRYSLGATLFINPTNGFGDEVVPRNRAGREVEKVYSRGPYDCAADDFKL